MQYLILFREPDGRKDEHPPEETALHRQRWQQWMEQMTAQNRLAGGKPLTLRGNVIKGKDPQVTEGPHTVGTEIVGGYLIINADSLEEATTLVKSCPIFEFDGYAEVRETM